MKNQSIKKIVDSILSNPSLTPSYYSMIKVKGEVKYEIMIESSYTVREEITGLTLEEGFIPLTKESKILSIDNYKPAPWVKTYQFYIQPQIVIIKRSKKGKILSRKTVPYHINPTITELIINKNYNIAYYLDDLNQMTTANKCIKEMHYVTELINIYNSQTGETGEKLITRPIVSREQYLPAPAVKKYALYSQIAIFKDFQEILLDSTPLNPTHIISNPSYSKQQHISINTLDALDRNPIKSWLDPHVTETRVLLNKATKKIRFSNYTRELNPGEEYKPEDSHIRKYKFQDYQVTYNNGKYSLDENVEFNSSKEHILPITNKRYTQKIKRLSRIQSNTSTEKST